TDRPKSDRSSWIPGRAQSNHAGVKIGYLLSGIANSHPVRIAGGGEAHGSKLRLALRAEETPLDWDQGLVMGACVDALVAAVAGLASAPPGEPLVCRTAADFVAEGGVQAGTVVAIAAVERSAGRLDCQVQLLEARLPMEVGERVTRVHGREVRAYAVGGGVAMIGATSVEASHGKEHTALD